MKPDIEQHIIYDPADNEIDLDHLLLENRIDLLSVFDDNKKLISIKKKKNNNQELINLIDDNLESNNKLFINVAISSAITGYSRIFMSLFKNNPKFKLYYSDTDSAFIDETLEDIYPELIGNGLGQLKPEYNFKKALFLAPKVYGGITQDGKTILKVKGININKNPITFEQLESLINKNIKLELPNEKWYRSLGKGSIEIKQEVYKLALNSTKRKLIYDQNDKLIGTEPIEINEKDK